MPTRLGLLLLAFLALALPVLAQGTSEMERLDRTYVQPKALPKPDSSGEYTRSLVGTHPFWEVVAKGGLNGRASDSAGADAAGVAGWPVKAVFPPGTLLTATAGPRTNSGLLAVFDRAGQSWLRVRLPGLDPDAVCYVRAHRDFVRPVRVLEQ